MRYHCSLCKVELEPNDAYEYRGAISCDEHFDAVCNQRNYERAEIIREESIKTNVFLGLDLDSKSKIGVANRELLSSQIEIAKKESARLKNYERKE